MNIWIIVLVIAILLIDKRYKDDIKDLKKENQLLRERLKKYELNNSNENRNILEIESQKTYEIKNDVSLSVPVNDTVYDVQSSREEIILEKHEQPKLNKEYEKKAEKDSRNTLILTVGASFIVIAAISFLFASWSFLSNILKSGILVSLAIMFFGMSKLAKKVFKLPKTSKTFYYMGLGYIPIVLFSFSMFKFLGEYFSLTGEGRYIYFTICSFLVMALYLHNSFKLDDIKLYYAGNFMQIVSIVCASLIFTESVSVIYCVLLIYSVIYNYFSLNIGTKFKNSTCAYAEAISFLSSIVGIIFTFKEFGNILAVIYPLIIYINFVILYKRKQSNELLVPLQISLFMTVVCFINIKLHLSGITHELPYIVKQIFITIYVLLTSGYYNFMSSKSDVAKINNILNLICLSFMMFPIHETMIPGYIFVIIANLIAVSVYLKNDRKEMPLLIATLIISYIALAINGTVITCIISVLLTLISSVLFEKNENQGIKIIPILGMLISCTFAETFIPRYIFIAIAYLIAEILYHKNEMRDKGVYISTLIISYILLLVENNIYTFLITTTMTITANMSLFNDENKSLKLIPVLGYIPHLYGCDVLMINGFDIVNLISVITIIIFTVINIKKNDSFYTIGSFIYLVGFLIRADYMNEYLKIIVIALWCLAQMIYTNGVSRDVIKTILYTNLLWLYMKVIHDIGIDDITFVIILGIFVYAYWIIRGLIKKYAYESYKAFEYIVYALSYMAAFGMYKDTLDITLFIAFLVSIIIVSYLRKMGPAFFCSMIALVANMFYLTRNFWLSIPWWVFLVAVGGVLISFAIRNEIHETKKNMESLKEKFSKAKEYLDM